MSDLAAMYLLGLFSGIAIGAIGAFIALRPQDGWSDVMKGRTTVKQFKDAGIGVAKKSD